MTGVSIHLKLVEEAGPVRSDEVLGSPDELLEQAIIFHPYDCKKVQQINLTGFSPSFLLPLSNIRRPKLRVALPGPRPEGNHDQKKVEPRDHPDHQPSGKTPDCRA